MAIHQALDEVDALSDLVLGVVQGRGDGISPVLAVLGLEVEDHQDHTVVCAQVHGVVIVAQLLLECLAGSHQIIQRLGNFGDASLVEGGHVPEEDTAGHGNGHALLAVCNVAGVHGSVIPLGQIQELGNSVQVHELAAVSRVVVQPVPVHLAHILCVASDEGSCHLLFPAGPCGEGGLDGDVGVLSLELLDGVLVSLVTAVAAPPADGHGNRAVRQCQALVCRSSGSGRSGGSSRVGCSRVAAAGSQKAGSAHSAGDLHKITTRNCLAHFCSPPKYRKHHLERGFCTYPVVYNYDNKTTTKKKDANCRYLNKKRTNIALVFARELTPLLK